MNFMLQNVRQVRRALRKMYEAQISAGAQQFREQKRHGFVEEVFAAIAATGAGLVSWDDEKKGKKKGDKKGATGKPHARKRQPPLSQERDMNAAKRHRSDDDFDDDFDDGAGGSDGATMV